jgi:large subunit ribosomal protein L24
MRVSKTVTRVKVKPRIHMSVRKNDEVIVIAGKDRGKRGRVLQVMPERNRVVVEGVNMIKRHTKANPQKQVKGGIVEREGSIHASNVQPVDPSSGKATRVGHRVLDDNRRVRVARRSGELLDK